MLFPKHHLFGTDIPSSEITPQSTAQHGRRHFLAAMAATAAAGMLPLNALADNALHSVANPRFQASDPQTPFAKATTYNNFYEFGESKDEPAKNAHTLVTRLWSIEIAGLVKKPQKVTLDDLASLSPA